jgi:hypothetical protein
MGVEQRLQGRRRELTEVEVRGRGVKTHNG